MFSKSIVICALLAVFAFQGLNASAINNQIESRATLGELIDQVKQVIENLKSLVTGVVGDALGTLANLVTTVTELKDKILNEGLGVITESIGHVVEYIKNVTAQAAELGIDVTKCITGREEQLEQLAGGLVANLTDCVTTTANSVITMVNNDLKVVNDVVKNITNIPVELSKCLISLRPITCVETLLTSVTTMLGNLPGQIATIVSEATKLVQALPDQLLGCVTNIGLSSATQTAAIIADIGKCVADIIDGDSQLAKMNRLTLAELIEEVKELIEGLNSLVNTVLGDALKTLGNLINVIKDIKDKVLDEGLAAIGSSIQSVVEFIKNATSHAAELGVDITQCITGRQEQLEQLATGLTGNLTTCVTTGVDQVLTMVNADLKVVSDIVKNVVNLPVQLAKCLISLRPIKCVEDLITNLSALLKALPGQIAEIIKNASDLVESLPTLLLECVENITTSSIAQTTQMITDIATCVDAAIGGETGGEAGGATL